MLNWKIDNSTNFKKLTIVIAGPAFLILAGLGMYFLGGRYILTDNAYVKAEKILITSEINGRIKEVKISDNTRVKKGDTLIVIDSQPYQIAVDKSEANLNAVKDEIGSLRSKYQQKYEEFEKADENLKFYENEYERYKNLADQLAVSKQQSDKALHNYNSAKSSKKAAYQEVEILKAKLGGNINSSIEDNPSYQLAFTELEKAQLDLLRVNIIAPSDGIITNVEKSPGEYITSGLPIFTLINDSNQWVEANFKETDLTNILVGQNAEIEVDTYPGVKWEAKVASITPATGSEFSILPAQNSSGNWVKVVQRIKVRLNLNNNHDKPKLASGMSAHVRVDTEKRRLSRILNPNQN